jgi:hypothetical protein
MAVTSFARIGYKNADNEFQAINVRAQDVITTTGVSAETHISDAAKHLTADQAAAIAGAIQSTAIGAASGVAPLGANSKIPAQYVDVDLFSNAQFVDTYADMLDLTATQAPKGDTILVEDASGDETVDSGWALYIRKDIEGETDTDWLKLVESEGIDIDFSEFATLGEDGKVPATQLPLSDATDSDSDEEAATSAAVKAAYDAGVLLDAAYCSDEEDMAEKNLRVGAFVLMEVDNTTVDAGDSGSTD